MPTDITAIARAVEAQGHDFLTWADWYPGGHPDTHWTKKYPQTFPATRHWVHHSVTSATAGAIDAARSINNIGIARFGKMSYPFLIHWSGAIIQGCYPYIGAHTKGYNSTSLAGCNIGNYEEITPNERLIKANSVLINALVSTGHYAHYDINILGHRDSPAASTACPGKYLYARLDTIRANVGPPPPPPIPIIRPKDDSMFAYEYRYNTTLITVHVAGGKQTRVDGQQLAVRLREMPAVWVGEIGTTMFKRYEEQYGPVLGAPT